MCYIGNKVIFQFISFFSFCFCRMFVIHPNINLPPLCTCLAKPHRMRQVDSPFSIAVSSVHCIISRLFYGHTVFLCDVLCESFYINNNFRLKVFVIVIVFSFSSNIIIITNINMLSTTTIILIQCPSSLVSIRVSSMSSWLQIHIHNVAVNCY